MATHVLEGGVGEGVQAQVTTLANTLHPKTFKGKSQTLAIISTETIVPRKVALSPTSAQDAEETIHCSNVTANKISVNKKYSFPNNNSCVTAHNALKRVRSAIAMGTAKVTRLCAHSQRHQEVGDPAGQGERALRATHTPTAVRSSSVPLPLHDRSSPVHVRSNRYSYGSHTVLPFLVRW